MASILSYFLQSNHKPSFLNPTVRGTDVISIDPADFKVRLGLSLGCEIVNSKHVGIVLGWLCNISPCILVQTIIRVLRCCAEGAAVCFHPACCEPFAGAAEVVNRWIQKLGLAFLRQFSGREVCKREGLRPDTCQSDPSQEDFCASKSPKV